MRMRPRMQRWLAVLVFVTVIGAFAACGQATDGGETLDGQALLEARCTQCHSLDRVRSQSLTQDEWQGVVEDMVAKGANLNAEEQEVLVEYLAQEYGP